MNVCYIAGPYRGDTIQQVEANIQVAENEALWWWKNGFAAICPHLNTRGFERIIPDQDIFINGDLAMVKMCDFIVMLPWWKSSEGAKSEYVRAMMSALIIIDRHQGTGNDDLHVVRGYSSNKYTPNESVVFRAEYGHLFLQGERIL